MGEANGAGDMLFVPALLGWHGERFHQIAGLEFFLPTGGFDATQLATTSRGYCCGGPAHLSTWFPTDEVELSVSSIHLHNWKNPDTQYQSGQEVNIDYGLGYAFTPAWQGGVSGYYHC